MYCIRYTEYSRQSYNVAVCTRIIHHNGSAHSGAYSGSYIDRIIRTPLTGHTHSITARAARAQAGAGRVGGAGAAAYRREQSARLAEVGR